MTPSEKRMVRSLIAVAWADGDVDPMESGIIEGLLVGLDASAEEEQELMAYAHQRRTLEDIPLSELNIEERELLFSNAVLLARADGTVSEAEGRVLGELARRLQLTAAEARQLAEAVNRTAPK